MQTSIIYSRRIVAISLGESAHLHRIRVFYHNILSPAPASMRQVRQRVSNSEKCPFITLCSQTSGSACWCSLWMEKRCGSLGHSWEKLSFVCWSRANRHHLHSRVTLLPEMNSFKAQLLIIYYSTRTLWQCKQRLGDPHYLQCVCDLIYNRWPYH